MQRLSNGLSEACLEGSERHRLRQRRSDIRRGEDVSRLLDREPHDQVKAKSFRP